MAALSIYSTPYTFALVWQMQSIASSTGTTAARHKGQRFAACPACFCGYPRWAVQSVQLLSLAKHRQTNWWEGGWWRFSGWRWEGGWWRFSGWRWEGWRRVGRRRIRRRRSGRKWWGAR